ncbi:MAG: nucleoside monophosphate kinase [Patescibacteria group bacterium]
MSDFYYLVNIEPRLWAVVIVGPPGAGKDTQAELLATELGLVQLKTSEIIEEKFSLASPDDHIIQEQIKIKDSGGINDSTLVTEWFIERLRKVHADGRGVVVSGSPRALSEAEAEMPVFEELYKAEGVKVIYIKVSEEESVKRNSFRRVCEKNGHPIPNFPEYESLTVCPQDGGSIITRKDDTPETISHRYKVYTEQTEPIVDFLSKKGYNVITINGEQSIENVHRDILDKLW